MTKLTIIIFNPENNIICIYPKRHQREPDCSCYFILTQLNMSCDPYEIIFNCPFPSHPRRRRLKG